MRGLYAILLSVLALTTAVAQNLTPVQPALQEYIDGQSGEQQFLNARLPDKNVATVSAWLTTRLLDGTTGYGLKFSNSTQSPSGTYYSFDLLYNNLPVFGKMARVMLDNSNTVRWLYHTVNTVSSQSSNTITESYITNHYQNNYPLLLLKDKGLLWVNDGATLLPSFFYTLKDTLRYTVEQLVFDEKGKLLYINPLYSQYAASDTPVSALAFVYDPDPLTTAKKEYGQDSLANNGGTDNSMFQKQLRLRSFTGTLDNDSVILSNGDFIVQELTSPMWPGTKVKVNHTFKFPRSHHSFGEINAFYHLTNYLKYVRTLGFTGLPGFRIQVDAHAFNGQERSQYTPGDNPPSLQFGDGGIPDAEDADVIIHEFSHALANGASPALVIGTERRAMDEGLGDYFAASYSKSINDFKWWKVFTWDGNNGGWQGRTVNYGTHYPNLTNSIWTDGQIWSTAFIRIYDNTNRIVADKLMLEALYRLAPNMKMPQLAEAVLQIDSIQNNKAYQFQINCAFSSMGILPQLSGCVYGLNDNTAATDICTVYNTFGFSQGGNLVIESKDNDIYTARITDLSGKTIYSAANIAFGEPLIISGQNLSTGFYFLIIENSRYQKQVVKLARF
ncbi:MAG TPA: hypothetical protein VEC12_05020 [Bacteroidia bacterium]|nr:hypothetical protein [Bacteroidia bacterium]